ncbi:uncharacterized protein LOC125209342 isoform X1 [Salvia hispanica]|uniref:uncharacterized protein LOC125209342 isoform X1 n=1 Tax=Salvia hispanica TaxID=49212 RepID=UPI002009B21D|nr:uncharacterized protein LOC125209342 isoform X1 [Salvia hispanica]
MTMVVVGLIAAMAFHADVNPPGGGWQDDTSSHRAGKAVMASTHPTLYKHFSRANTAAFVSSVLVIFLVAVRAPTNAFVFVMVSWYATLAAMAAIGVSYGASLIMTNPVETETVGEIVAEVVSVFVGIYVLVIVCGYVEKSYFAWKRRRLQRGDVAIIHLITRCFYHIQRDVESTPIN